MKNVMLIGKMASGKTTLANLLVYNLGYNKIALADPIKRVVYGLANGENMLELLYKNIFDKVDLTIDQQDTFIAICEETVQIDDTLPKLRKRLQHFGTDGGRDRVAKDIWISCLKADIATGGPYVIDDVRFLNEAIGLSSNFEPVLLTIDKDTQLKRLNNLYDGFDQSVLKHASEQEFQRIAEFFKNNAIHSWDEPLTLDTSLPLEECFEQIRAIIKGA
jgi:dephospho-CoA kinase